MENRRQCLVALNTENELIVIAFYCRIFNEIVCVIPKYDCVFGFSDCACVVLSYWEMKPLFARIFMSFTLILITFCFYGLSLSWQCHAF